MASNETPTADLEDFSVERAKSTSLDPTSGSSGTLSFDGIATWDSGVSPSAVCGTQSRGESSQVGKPAPSSAEREIGMPAQKLQRLNDTRFALLTKLHAFRSVVVADAGPDL